MMSSAENQLDDPSNLLLPDTSIPDEMEVDFDKKHGNTEDADDEDAYSSDLKTDYSRYGNKSLDQSKNNHDFQHISTGETDSTHQDMSSQMAPVFAIPSLRGKFQLTPDGKTYVCKGVWAMSDALHEIPGQTSPFEFKLVNPALSPQHAFPISGRYSGWFLLQQPTMKSPMKVEDKEINLRFIPTDCGHTIEGEGHNKFGKFTVHGSLSDNTILQMYRSYTPKPLSTTNKSKKASTTPTSALPKKSSPSKIPNSSKTPKASKTGPSTSVADNNSSAVAGVSREPSSRSRKSSAFSFKEADTGLPPPQPPQPAYTTQQPSPALTNLQSQSITAGRTPRLSQPLLRCSDMLKDLIRQPQAIWFNEPVDYVKLNIPDYPTIIKDPMDFKTIRLNLEKNLYKTPEEFAEHIRLTFRNAITYNTLRDNPVHIAAREMSNRFEEKYRVMMSQLGSSAITLDYDNSSPRNGGGGGKRSRKGSSIPKRTSNGPRSMDTDSAAPLAGLTVDGNVLAVMEDLNRKIREMQSEITHLRTAVKHPEVLPTKEKQEKIKRTVVLEPLTLEEKRALINRIHKLQPERMTKVVAIIQAALPPSARDDSDEVEIPLDELDTKTLRKLQDYVQSVPMMHSAGSKRKRQTMDGAGAGPGRPPNSARPSYNAGGTGDLSRKGKGKEIPVNTAPGTAESAGRAPPAGPPPQPGPFFSSYPNAHQGASTAADRTHPHDQNFHFASGGQELEDDDDLPDIYNPESDDAEDEDHHKTEPSNAVLAPATKPVDNPLALYNASAWNSDVRSNGNGFEDHSKGDSSSANPMWGEAKSEKYAQIQREAERRTEEDRLTKLKNERQNPLLNFSSQYSLDTSIDVNEEKIKQYEREQERIQRESIAATLPIESSADILHLMEDV